MPKKTEEKRRLPYMVMTSDRKRPTISIVGEGAAMDNLLEPADEKCPDCGHALTTPNTKVVGGSKVSYRACTHCSYGDVCQLVVVRRYRRETRRRSRQLPGSP
jgi:hypothetical protein